MFPPRFDYERAESLAGALETLATDPDAVPLAGGHALVPALKRGETAVGTLVDLTGLELSEVDADADGVSVGPLARHADLLDSDALADHAPVLAATAADVGDRQIRNRGTVGGNLAAAEGGADLPAAVVAADATLHLRSRDGSRTVAADEFFEGVGETALRDGELIVDVTAPAHDAGAYAKKTHPASGYAAVGVAAAFDTADGAVSGARVAVTGATTHPVRLEDVEAALVGTDADPETVTEAAEAATVPDRATRGDHHASASYRRAVLPTYVERAVTAALRDVGGGAGR